MSPPARIASFVAVLAAAFAVAFVAGSAFEPAGTEAGGDHGEMAAGMESSHGGEAAVSHGGHEEGAEAAGLAVAEGGYALRLETTSFRRGEPGELRFRIEDAGGAPVRRFDELHERRMHLILVRRDGSGFQHLHPGLAADGTWAVAVEFPAAGDYRAFADFSVAGEQHTLASDLFVSGGEFEARPFPAPATLAATDGYEVTLNARAPRAGRPAQLTFAVSRGEEEVDDLQPYLGAKGHLVALRQGDLAYLHVHPEEGGHEHDGRAAAAHPNEIAFAATFPTPGRYRLYLQFRHQDVVRTAEFTVEVAR
ncbi:MAG TPA: hypothetical protein VFX85_06415 [Solirubrobacterales bacterium]|nr:hypothetical protein [Solirubrobacterales bacterium]